MLPSPATERTKSKNIPLDLQLTSCEAQRDLVFARAREPLNQRNHRRAHRTGILKPLRFGPLVFSVWGTLIRFRLQIGRLRAAN